MTGQEAIAYIHSINWRGSRLGLMRTRELLESLGNPERALRFVHIAGTNGKGSTAAMLSGMLQAAGYKVGLYTSPYIQRFHERMQINGVPISDAALGEVTALVRRQGERMQDPPTEFELVTAIAFLWFWRESCDAVVLETGLGGRLDSTNVIPSPAAAVITRIGLDHVKELGGTLELIAAEKAGIIKPGCDVVVYPQESAVMGVFEEACAQQGAVLRTADFSALCSLKNDLDGQVFTYGAYSALYMPLLGRHQLENAAVALTVVDVLRGKGFCMTEGAVREGLRQVRWPARFEVVHQNPLVILDGGHNLQGAVALCEAMREYLPERQAVCMVGVLRDKAYAAMLGQIAPHACAFVAVQPTSDRALPKEELAKHLAAYKKPVIIGEDIKRGMEHAMELAGKGGTVVAFGSLYMVGHARSCF